MTTDTMGDAVVSDDSADGVKPPPPSYVSTLTIAAVLVHYFVHPLHIEFPDVGPIHGRTVLVLLGVILLLSGVILTVGPGMFYKASGQSVLPNTKRASLVITGLNKYSRNPIYAGLLAAQSAVALFVGSYWILMAVGVCYVIILVHAVLPEERFLEKRFGEEYLQYKASVRRWI